MSKLKNIFSRKNKEHAQTMVEFALVFPFILLITYGIIEFGRMVFIYTAVTGAAREGARYGAAAGDLGNNLTRYYMDCTGILNAVQRGAILTPINSNDVTIWYDHGPDTNHIKNTCPPEDANGKDLINIGDRIGVHVVAHFSPIIPILGVDGFDINSENARTILVNVDVVGTPMPPMPTNTLTRTPGPSPTRTPNYTPTISPTSTQSGTPTHTPTVTQTWDPTQTPTITPTPACIINNDGMTIGYDFFEWTLTSRSTALVRLQVAGITWPGYQLNPLAISPAPGGGNILAKTDTPTPTSTITPTAAPTSTASVTPTITPTPVPSDNLIQVDIGVNAVWQGNQPPTSWSTGSWTGDQSRRELSPGGSHTLTFSFSDYLPTGDYAGTLTYVNVTTGQTCSVSFSEYKP